MAAKPAPRIDKAALLAKLRSDLEEAVIVMEKAAATAHDAATHPEMKPENDKDTRGIEAGYLAGAQSERAMELRRTLNEIKALKPRAFKAASDAVDVTALVELQDANDDKKPRVVAFICPHGGGLKVKVGAVEVQVVTPSSPLGDAVMGKKLGDIVELHAGGKMRELEIVAVS
jgi:transcription elongation GreA/GreB family factor